MANLVAGVDYPILSLGTPQCFQKTIVCSTITTGAVNWITCINGAAMIVAGSVETDGTGLAGMTNLVFTTDNASGLLTIFSSAISGLGANKTLALQSGGTTACVFPFVLESGKHIKINGTANPGSGVGVLSLNLDYRILSGAPYLL